MSAFIDLDDGRTWLAANWAYDAVIEAIADELNCTALDAELADWLRLQTCSECGPGLGSVDLRELSPACRIAFRDAARRAIKSIAEKGPAKWHDPRYFPAWIEKFQDLVAILDAIDRGEPPTSETQLAQPTGRRVGPGW